MPDSPDSAARFAYRAPTDIENRRHQDVARLFMVVAGQIASETPPCRAQSLALTRLQEAQLWAHQAVREDEAEIRRKAASVIP